MPSINAQSLPLVCLARVLLLLGTVEAPAAQPPFSQDPCRSGFEALQLKEIVVAVPLLEKCIVTGPSEIRPYLALCGIYQSQGRSDDLFRVAAAGLKRFPGEKRFYLTVGNHLGRKESYQEAIQVFEAGYRRWPDDKELKEGLADALLYLGLRVLDKNENQEAEKHLRKVTELADGNIDAHLNLGRALHNLNRSTDAVTEFDKVIALDPKLPLAWFHRGMVLQSLGEIDRAIAD